MSFSPATSLVGRILRGSAAAPGVLHAFTKAATATAPVTATATATTAAGPAGDRATATTVAGLHSPAPSVSASPSSKHTVYNRPPPNYPGHVPLTKLERLGLAVGSAVGAFFNPRRADLIAACGEATATPYFIYRLRDAMLADPTGRRILRDRPRITSTSLNIPYLRSLPPNTVGGIYAAWLDREHVSPDTRAPVRYIDDEECAYVMQRYRECHDFYHALMGMPTMREGEVALKAFEFMNTLLPMTGLSVFAAATLKPKEKERFWKMHLPWAIRAGLRSGELINVYWEEVLEMDVGELRKQLNIEVPPDLRDIRAKSRKEKKEREERERLMREGLVA